MLYRQFTSAIGAGSGDDDDESSSVYPSVVPTARASSPYVRVGSDASLATAAESMAFMSPRSPGGDEGPAGPSRRLDFDARLVARRSRMASSGKNLDSDEENAHPKFVFLIRKVGKPNSYQFFSSFEVFKDTFLSLGLWAKNTIFIASQVELLMPIDGSSLHLSEKILCSPIRSQHLIHEITLKLHPRCL